MLTWTGSCLWSQFCPFPIQTGVAISSAHDTLGQVVLQTPSGEHGYPKGPCPHALIEQPFQGPGVPVYQHWAEVWLRMEAGWKQGLGLTQGFSATGPNFQSQYTSVSYAPSLNLLPSLLLFHAHMKDRSLQGTNGSNKLFGKRFPMVALRFMYFFFILFLMNT